MGSLIVLLYIIIVGIPYQFDCDPHIGLFGWFTMEDNHFYILLYIAVIVNVVGMMGFVRAMQYFDNIIIAVATLLEPMIAALIAYIFQAGPIPGYLGWIGNILVVIGTIAVIYPSMYPN
jgi:drug/metabolite transporter (DMT)-like permease